MSAPLDMDALWRDDDAGHRIRAKFTLGVETGAIDPLLALKLAQMCHLADQPVRGLWFLALGVRSPTFVADGWANCLADLVRAIPGLAAGSEGAAALARLFAAVDGLGADAEDACMEAVLRVLPAGSDEARRAAEALAATDAGPDSQAFLGFALAAHGDHHAARACEDRLRAMPTKTFWTYRVLGERAARRGDLDDAAALGDEAARRHGQTAASRGLEAAVRLALGRDDEALALVSVADPEPWRRMVAFALDRDRTPERQAAVLGRIADLIDGLGRGDNDTPMQTAVEAVAEAGLDVRVAAALDGEAEAGEARLGLGLAVRLFGGDLDGAREAARALERLAAPSRWSLSAVAKIAALDGDYARAARVCHHAIAAWGASARMLLQKAAALTCAGRREEAHAALTQGLALLPAEVVARRRAELGAWAEQLRAAVAGDVEDGGALGRLGSSAPYRVPRHVRPLWHRHRWEAAEANTQRTVAAFTNTTMFAEIERLLAARADLRTVVNFGTLCGVRDAALAARHPQTTWIGYDVSDLATALNREHFAAPNLIFEADLDRLLARLGEAPGTSLLAHCRSADVMLPAAMRRLYRSCFDAGVGLVLAAEYVNFRIETLDYPDFRIDDADALHWDGVLMIHNYDRVLPAAGYRILSSVYRPVPLLVQDHGLQETLLIRLVLAGREAGARQSVSSSTA